MAGDPPDWFTGADAHILFILNSGLTLTPSIIAENSDVTRQTVSKRLNTLQAGGYVEKVDRGKYKITPDGRFVVTGDPEVDPEDLDYNDENEGQSGQSPVQIE
ncbi:MarR family transcriptional regulator [Haloplanus salinus]|uniref:MarR family transcriptional regulator n=1 Tax=Haloplanus salinus TaxID=1126245 RepID=A0A368NGZ1_9EURY|nr:MarR family transcriptional regulator [Haloplanus salinus]